MPFLATTFEVKLSAARAARWLTWPPLLLLGTAQGLSGRPYERLNVGPDVADQHAHEGDELA
jgi:hypothetical protein